jgi:hypothetical protein
LELAVHGLELKVDAESMYVDRLAFWEKGNFIFFDETQLTTRIIAKAEMLVFNKDIAVADKQKLDALITASKGLLKEERQNPVVITTKVLKFDGFGSDLVTLSFSNHRGGTFSIRKRQLYENKC